MPEHGQTIPFYYRIQITHPSSLPILSFPAQELWSLLPQFQFCFFFPLAIDKSLVEQFIP